VQVSVPEKSGFRLDARTHGGEIQSDFSELKINNDDDHESRATGSVGNAMAHIVVNNEHDGIEIRKESLQPPKPPEPAHPAKPGKNLPAPKADVEPEEQ